MSNWQSRSEINEDVVYFRYIPERLEKGTEEVFVWDLDKTYLDTSIDSFFQLLTTAVERALNKKNIPGTKTLLQSLSKFSTKQSGKNQFPIYFITASPPQMEERIYEKFILDGLRPFGVFYKDNLRNLRPEKFWRLKKQVGYKVQALLQLRLRLSENVKQICWGDDSESDAIIYNLYSDICARRIGTQDLRYVLKNLGVFSEQIDAILMLQSQVPEGDPVQKIYINLAVDTDPDYYLKFGRRTLPTYNTFQIAIDLFQDDHLDFDSLLVVAEDMTRNYGFTADELVRSFDELIRRHVLGQEAALKLISFFIEKEIFYADYKPSMNLAKVKTVENNHVIDLEGHFEPWIQGRIDYLHDYR